LRRAWGRAPSVFGFSSAFEQIRDGVAGRNRPARGVAQDAPIYMGVWSVGQEPSLKRKKVIKIVRQKHNRDTF